jgi:hypothetical protein
VSSNNFRIPIVYCFLKGTWEHFAFFHSVSAAEVLCMQSWLNGICKQTKCPARSGPDKLEHSTDGHFTYLISFHKIYLSFHVELKPYVIYRVTLHFDCPKFLIAFQAVMDGRWADMGWHNIFLASPQCHLSLPFGSHIDTYEQMEGRDEGNRCFSQLCKLV